MDVDNDQRFRPERGDVPLTAGELQDGSFDTRVSEGSYDAAAAGCDGGTTPCGLVISAATGLISHPVFNYLADGNVVVGVDLTSTGLTPSHIESRRRDVLLLSPTITALRTMTIKAAGQLIATGGNTIQSTQTQGFLSLDAGGDSNVSGSTVRGGRSLTLKADGQVVAIGTTLENTDRNAGRSRLIANGGQLNVNGSTVRGGRRTTLIASGDIQASAARIRITTASADPFVHLTSGRDLNIATAAITDSGGESAIKLEAAAKIDCTGSTLNANDVSVQAGGEVMNCPE